MHYLLSMLPMLVTGMIILMTGILITRDPAQKLQIIFNESLIWGGAFFLSFGAEVLLVANV